MLIYYDDHSVINVRMESLCYVPETKIILYVIYLNKIVLANVKKI